MTTAHQPLRLRVFTEPQQGADYSDLLAVARRAEDAGYDAFFRSDHYLRMGGVDGRPGPTDAWVTLAGLARETTTIRLGTLMTAITFRLPGPLAIAVAQVDRMSGGRVEFGVGSGWYAEEHTAYGIPFPDLGERFERYAEQLAVVTGLWHTPEGETFSFDGKHYRLTDSPALPKPAQRPGPPVIIGGFGARSTPRLAAKHADEFNLPFTGIPTCVDQFARVDQACAAVGRAPLRRSIAQVVCVGRDEAEFTRRAAAIDRDPAELRQNGIAGTVEDAVETIGRWREATAISALYLQFLDLADLDHIDLVAAEVAPRL